MKITDVLAVDSPLDGQTAHAHPRRLHTQRVISILEGSGVNSIHVHRGERLRFDSDLVCALTRLNVSGWAN